MRTAPCYIPKLSASRVSSPVEGVRAEQPASGLVVYIASRAAEFVEVIDAVIVHSSCAALSVWMAQQGFFVGPTESQ